MKNGIDKSVLKYNSTQGIKEAERRQQIKEANVAIKL